MAENGVVSMWDVPLQYLFSIATGFYRKEKDKIHLEYEQKVQLLALCKQEKYGPHTPEKDTETGYFDIIGADRRKAWINLGDMSREEAQKELVRLVHSVAPQLKDYALEQWRIQKPEVEKGKRDEHHTTDSHIDGQTEFPREERSTTRTPSATPTKNSQWLKSALAPAALWCSPKAARQFISESRASSEYQLNVNPGETVTVQVPTSPGATAIFWEFVTTSGDIGFGLNFQRSSDDFNQTYPVESLLPIVKRDCSEDLVLGSHQYQVSGTYFLRFDNSHCPHASKIVYYKVFYQKST